MQIYNKLVRDLIPDRILAKGETCAFHRATDDEYREKLREKFVEEWQEYLEGESPDELADMLEVIDALAVLGGNTFADVVKKKELKFAERGGFTAKIILEQS